MVQEGRCIPRVVQDGRYTRVNSGEECIPGLTVARSVYQGGTGGIPRVVQVGIPGWCIYPGIPWWVYLPGVYSLLHHPGYTYPQCTPGYIHLSVSSARRKSPGLSSGERSGYEAHRALLSSRV